MFKCPQSNKQLIHNPLEKYIWWGLFACEYDARYVHTKT